MNNLILKHLLLQHVLMVIEESESITYSHQLSGMIQGLDPMTLWSQPFQHFLHFHFPQFCVAPLSSSNGYLRVTGEVV